jgi:tRNA(adenine34) deaminase
MNSVDENDARWMRLALDLAREAQAIGEVPVGAVVVKDDQVAGEGFNTLIRDNDPSAHAEMTAIRNASQKLGNYRLPGTTLYVTLEPCSMCAGVIVQARISRVVYGADDPRTGAARSVFRILDNPALNHRCEVVPGVLAAQSSEMLRDFFRARR